MGIMLRVSTSPSFKTSSLAIRLPLFSAQYHYDCGNDEYKDEQHHRAGDERLPMQARRVGKAGCNVGRKGTNRVEQAVGELCDVPADQNDRGRFAEGAAQRQDNRGDDAGHRRGEHGAEDGALLRGAERQRALVITLGYRAQGVFADADDSGQNHDAEHERRRQQARPAAAECAAHKGNDNDEPEIAVDDGRDARENIDDGLHDFVQPFGAVKRHKHRDKQADGYADHERAGRGVRRADDKRADAVQIVTGQPGSPENKVKKADFCDRRNGENKQINADDRNDCDKNRRRNDENDLHDHFFYDVFRVDGQRSVCGRGLRLRLF